MVFSALISVIVLFGFYASGKAHFHSVEPSTYNGPRACDRCKTACPSLGDSSDSPVATWQRGETVSNVYTRNNHHGGFMRWSLVPIEHMYDEEWHSKNAFLYGCWEADIENCGSEDCGSDKKDKRFRRTFDVPAVYPDGIYIFASVWYGGTRYQRDFSLFSDYNTCAIVEIKGGTDVVESYMAKFVPGISSRDSVPDGFCLSASDRVRQCDGEPCNVSAKFMVPRSFADGNSPAPILSSDVGS